MPLKPKYEKIRAEMVKKYGAKKGEQVFHAWVNKQEFGKDVEAKSFLFLTNFKSFDDEFVEGDFAVGTPDSFHDILTENCEADMVKQLNDLPITLDDNHESFKNQSKGERFRATVPIAKVEKAWSDGYKVKVKAVLNKAHQRYEEIKSSIKNEFLHSFSFAYIPTQASIKSIDGVEHRVIEKLTLLNGCFTGVPVHEDAQFRNVALKSFPDFYFNESEVSKLIGGIVMGEEEEKPAETPKEETPAEAPKEVPAETPKETPAEAPAEAEEKALTVSGMKKVQESQAAEIAELKAKLEKQDISTELKAIQDKQAEFDKILSAPQFKAKSEQMKEILAAEVKARAENKGPLDSIK